MSADATTTGVVTVDTSQPLGIRPTRNIILAHQQADDKSVLVIVTCDSCGWGDVGLASFILTRFSTHRIMSIRVTSDVKASAN